MELPTQRDASTADGSDQPVVPWARQVSPAQSRSTNRSRRLVAGLPGWEPLPPGEMIVRRPKHG